MNKWKLRKIKGKSPVFFFGSEMYTVVPTKTKRVAIDNDFGKISIKFPSYR